MEKATIVINGYMTKMTSKGVIVLYMSNGTLVKKKLYKANYYLAEKVIRNSLFYDALKNLNLKKGEEPVHLRTMERHVKKAIRRNKPQKS